MTPARVAVAPNKYARGFDGSGRAVEEVYEVMDLGQALQASYATDAHLVTYVVAGAARQPRINKAGLPSFGRRVEVGVFMCDVDNPEHREWDGVLQERAEREQAELAVLQTTGVYHTQHGRRLVQPLAEPIAAARVEPYLRHWLLEVEAAGLAVDWACRDWTRHFRLPHVRRGGRAYRSPVVNLERMEPIALPAIPEQQEAPALPGAGRRAPGHATRIDWTSNVPAAWGPRIAPLAAAAREVTTEWHTLFLALAGAMLSRGVPAEIVPALCRAVSIETGRDSRVEDRRAAARSTVERYLVGEPTIGYRSLCEKWPAVADALDAGLAQGAEAHLRALSAAPPAAPPRSLGETTAALEDAIRRAPDGLTLISAECGLGKTAAAMRVAAERASKPYASAAAQGARAPVQSKTSISVDKNELAIQVAFDLRSMATGATVRRIFGPLSLLGADGKPVCRYHEVARPLVEGGQPMQWELCQGRDIEPCEYASQCPAKDGADGPSSARITVGTHALISDLDGSAGSTGLLVIDEPPPLLDTVVLSTDDLDTAARLLHAFDGRYAGAIAPAVEAIRAWVAVQGELGRVLSLADAVRAASAAVPAVDLAMARRCTGADGDAVECARAAQLPERRGPAPPIQFVYLAMAKRSAARATELGTASRVLRAIHQALTSEAPVAARVEQHLQARRLLLTSAREPLARALRREGAVVVTDANSELHAPVYAKVVGYEPPHHRFAAVDGASIERTLIRCRSATRRQWLTGRKFQLEPSLVSAVRAIFEWAQKDSAARRLGLITMQTLELALAGALRPDDRSVEAAWKEDGQPAAALAEARRVLGPIVSAWPGTVLLGHYGAVRGLNTMADADCLATLGDPWPNLGAVRNDIAFLGLEQAWEARLEAMCRAELEQAHGRLRTVHRSRPGRALHVGAVLPAGAGWASGQVLIRRLQGGRPRSTSAMTSQELAQAVLALGGLRAAARAIGCDPATVHRYVAGTRPIPGSVATLVAELVALQLPQVTPQGGCCRNP